MAHCLIRKTISQTTLAALCLLLKGESYLLTKAQRGLNILRKITDPQQYDASLVEALAARFAAEICYAITGSTSMVQIQTSAI
jgi:hypothetical protein